MLTVLELQRLHLKAERAVVLYRKSVTQIIRRIYSSKKVWLGSIGNFQYFKDLRSNQKWIRPFFWIASARTIPIGVAIYRYKLIRWENRDFQRL